LVSEGNEDGELDLTGINDEELDKVGGVAARIACGYIFPRQWLLSRASNITLAQISHVFM
jgi:hypothetical protein